MNRLRPSPCRARGFTLLEVCLALLIFSIAVVSLVGAINGMGQASIEARQIRNLESQLETTLLEITRMPPKEIMAGAQNYETTQRANGIDTHIKIDALTWQSEDGVPLQGLYMVKVTARRVGQGARDELSAECLLYPPLFHVAH
jgi:prepilin-type N-terminal cleavage/methylation domain-containing protein